MTLWITTTEKCDCPHHIPPPLYPPPNLKPPSLTHQTFKFLKAKLFYNWGLYVIIMIKEGKCTYYTKQNNACQTSRIKLKISLTTGPHGSFLGEGSISAYNALSPKMIGKRLPIPFEYNTKPDQENFKKVYKILLDTLVPRYFSKSLAQLHDILLILFYGCTHSCFVSLAFPASYFLILEFWIRGSLQDHPFYSRSRIFNFEI